MSEIKLAPRDAIKIDALAEIASGAVALSISVDGAMTDYLAARSRSGRVTVLGRFNLSESPDGSTLAIRASSPGGSMRLRLAVPDDAPARSLSVTRSATKETEQVVPLRPGELDAEIAPDGDGHRLTFEPRFRAKPPEALAADAAELRGQIEADAGALAWYEGSDAAAAAELLDRARALIDDAEGRIRALIEAGQNATMEIEREVKGGRPSSDG